VSAYRTGNGRNVHQPVETGFHRSLVPPARLLPAGARHEQAQPLQSRHRGRHRHGLVVALPAILGSDAVGTVAAIGALIAGALYIASGLLNRDDRR
jgi:hypothetical protein